MDDFLTIFRELDCHGPASEADTLAALAHVPRSPTKVLDIGCGPGNATLVLAKHTHADIVALDNLEQSLTRLQERAEEAGLSGRITAVNASMEEMPFEPKSFDLLWCENSVYAIGMSRALQLWKPFLGEEGTLVVSDLVWLREDVNDEVRQFWASEYPEMTTAEVRIAQAREAGFALLGTHELSAQAWENYYIPLSLRLEAIQGELADSDTIPSLQEEIAILKRHTEGDFGYLFFVLG